MTHDAPSSPRFGPAAFVLWIVPFLCVVESIGAFLVGWRPEGHLEHGLAALFALWLGTGGIAFFPACRRLVGTRWREWILLGATVAVGWIGMEWGAHTLEGRLRPPAPVHTRGTNLHTIHHPDPEHLVGIVGPSHFRTGPDGVRAPAPPDGTQGTRVLCIGGSTTECVYLDDEETWPSLVGQALANPGVWVGNVGISGFYTRDHLDFLGESPSVDGSAALVVQPGINDLWRYLAQEEAVTNFARFETPSEEVTPETPPRRDAWRPLWTRSRVLQLFHTLRAEVPPPEVQEGIGGQEYAIRRARRAAAEKTDQLPPLSVGLVGYRERIGAIIAACRAKGVPVLFTTQPVLWQAELSRDVAARCWFGWLDDGRYLSLRALREAMDQYNNELVRVCLEAGVPCVDLSTMNGNSAWFYDDCHFTEAGAREVAARVAPVLAGILP